MWFGLMSLIRNWFVNRVAHRYFVAILEESYEEKNWPSVVHFSTERQLFPIMACKSKEKVLYQLSNQVDNLKLCH